MKKNLIAMLLAFVFSLFLLEGSMRMYQFIRNHYFITSYQLYSYNKDWGNWHNSNVSLISTREGHGHVKTNSFGMLGEECTQQKPEDVFRIVFLGDSMTEGVEVDWDKNYCALTEQYLNEKVDNGKRIEVLNMAVSGQGTTQQYLVLTKKALEFDPDLVVLEFAIASDVRNNSRTLQADAQRPYFRIDEQGTLILDQDAQEQFERFYDERTASLKYRILNFFRDHSYFVTFCVQLIKSVRSGEIGLQGENRLHGKEEDLSLPSAFTPSNKAWSDAWRISEGVIEKMHAVCAQNNIRFSVLFVPTAAQYHYKQRDLLIAKFQESVVDYPEDRLTAFCQSKGIPIMVLTDYFLSINRADPQIYFNGFNGPDDPRGHWNQNGHTYCAQYLTEFLIAEGLLT